MLLTPTELERLTIFNVAELARSRRRRGLRLNCPEAIAVIVDAILEGAREGRSVADLISFGSTVLDSGDVLPGVAALMPMIQVEGSFPDGTKLVTVHDPIRTRAVETAADVHRPDPPDVAAPAQEASPLSRGAAQVAEDASLLAEDASLLAEDAARIPGEIIAAPGRIEINAGRRSQTLAALNTGDRPIQVGSHFHFFEVNKALQFDRRLAYGMRLDIAAGTAVRFEPGEEREVTLVTFGGSREVFGLNRLAEGSTIDDSGLEDALARARAAGFKGA